MTDFNEPQSLTEEAEAQGIEIMESSTTQIEVDPDIGDPLLQNEKSGEEHNEEQANGTEGHADDVAVHDRNEDQENLQEEVDKHEKAIDAVKTSLMKPLLNLRRQVILLRLSRVSLRVERLLNLASLKLFMIP